MEFDDILAARRTTRQFCTGNSTACGDRADHTRRAAGAPRVFCQGARRLFPSLCRRYVR